jgi:hypothetical protein
MALYQLPNTVLMPGFLLHVGASVKCAHGGVAQPSSPMPKVLLNGQAVTTQTVPYTIAGCPFNIAGGPSPCVIAQWSTASTKIFASGQPVLLLDSQAICTPNGTPLLIASTQTKVTGI